MQNRQHGNKLFFLISIFTFNRFELGVIARIFHPGLLSRFISAYCDMLTSTLSPRHIFQNIQSTTNHSLLRKYLDQLQSLQWQGWGMKTCLSVTIKHSCALGNTQHSQGAGFRSLSWQMDKDLLTAFL